MHKIQEMHHQKMSLMIMMTLNLALLQLRTTPVDTGLHSPATLLLNRPIRTLLPQMNKEPTNFTADDECHKVLNACQDKYIKHNDT